MKKYAIKVYIASPYSIGDAAIHVRRQLDAADKLMNHGFAPYPPLYSHFQHMLFPRPYQDWIESDLTWVEACDMLVRLRAYDSKNHEIPSSGADKEEAHARKLGKPVFVFDSVEEMDLWAKTFDKDFVTL